MKIYILLLSVFCLVACKDKSTISLHTDYFPLEEGAFVVYDAMTIEHDGPGGINDTLRFYLKVEIGEEELDNSGRTVRKYLRYQSLDSGATYTLKDVWTAHVDDLNAELVEENERIVKLVFAPSFDKEWNIHAYNTNFEQVAYYEDFHESRTRNGVEFDSTLKVVQADFFSLVDYQKQHEIYAKGVGLIERYFKDLTIDNFDTLDIQRGREEYFRYIEHGIN